MALTFTEEQEELRAGVRRFLADTSPMSEVRRLVETELGHDSALYRRMAVELGLHGIAVPDDLGGAGGGSVELAIALEETGRALLPGPFLASVGFAAQALLASGDRRAQERWLPGIAEGTLTATLAGALPAAAGITAREVENGWLLDGTAPAVVDGATAELLLVVADTADGPGLFAVEAGPAEGGPAGRGPARTPIPPVDHTRRVADVDLGEVAAVAVGPRPGTPEAAATVRTALDLAAVALAAEQLGGAQVCLETTVEYAKVREQFGRPIGSFQAVKHKCADMLLEVEGLRAAVYHAAGLAESAAGGPDPELTVAAALAAAYAGEAYVHVTKEAVQVHGGIGYTWEHDAHLYLKRATSSAILLGTPGAHRTRLAGLVGIGGGAA